MGHAGGAERGGHQWIGSRTSITGQVSKNSDNATINHKKYKTMNKTLFSINEDTLRINAMLEEMEGEITPELEELMAINDANLTEKAGQYRNAIMNNKADIEAAKAEIKRLQAFVKGKERANDNMSQRMDDALKLRGLTELKLDGGVGGRYSYRSSRQVVVDDESIIPDTLCTFKREVSKTAIKDAIEAGEDVAGAHIEDKQNLQIK